MVSIAAQLNGLEHNVTFSFFFFLTLTLLSSSFVTFIYICICMFLKLQSVHEIHKNLSEFMDFCITDFQ